MTCHKIVRIGCSAVAMMGMAVLTSLQADAATLDLGALDDGGYQFGGNYNNTAARSGSYPADTFVLSDGFDRTVGSLPSTLSPYTFSDVYTFTLSGTSDVSLSFITSNVRSFSETTNQIVGSNLVNYGSASNYADLSSGTYEFVVSGIINANTRGAYGGTVSVSAVPLPASLPLFAAALIGLGMMGYHYRKAEGKAEI